MTRIESNKVIINKPADNLYQFLSNFNNFQKLMPEQVTGWTSTEDECSFTITGMGTLGMKIIEKVPAKLVRIAKNGKAPFDFTLSCMINGKEADSEVQLAFDADLNPVLKMMAEKPLTNFLNILVEKMKNVPI